jgi:hypothetical protein
MHVRTGTSPVEALIASVLSVLPERMPTAGIDERADMEVYRLDDRVGNALQVDPDRSGHRYR